MWIMISGPYTAGNADAAQRARNLDAMNRAAAEVFDLGHTPIIGVNMALPMIAAAGAESFDRLMMPISLALADRCDACVRIAGPSKGADEEVERFRSAGKPIFTSIADIPKRSRPPQPA